MAEIEVDRKTGALRVPRAFAAADAGQIINPDGLRKQIEGGIIQSTSGTRDWANYSILTVPEVPRVEVELIDRRTERSLGVGEAAQGRRRA